MAKKQTTTLAEMAEIIRSAYNIPMFENGNGYTAKVKSQSQLIGKTHYVDENTLRYFKSLIVSARAKCGGLIYVITERTAADYENTKRGYRCVAFDLFGEVMDERPKLENLTTSKEKAEKVFADWLSGFDVVGHYKTRMVKDAVKAKADAAKLSKLVKTIKL